MFLGIFFIIFCVKWYGEVCVVVVGMFVWFGKMLCDFVFFIYMFILSGVGIFW